MVKPFLEMEEVIKLTISAYILKLKAYYVINRLNIFPCLHIFWKAVKKICHASKAHFALNNSISVYANESGKLVYLINKSESCFENRVIISNTDIGPKQKLITKVFASPQSKICFIDDFRDAKQNYQCYFGIKNLDQRCNL